MGKYESSFFLVRVVNLVVECQLVEFPLICSIEVKLKPHFGSFADVSIVSKEKNTQGPFPLCFLREKKLFISIYFRNQHST